MHRRSRVSTCWSWRTISGDWIIAPMELRSACSLEPVRPPVSASVSTRTTGVIGAGTAAVVGSGREAVRRRQASVPAISRRGPGEPAMVPQLTHDRLVQQPPLCAARRKHFLPRLRRPRRHLDRAPAHLPLRRRPLRLRPCRPRTRPTNRTGRVPTPRTKINIRERQARNQSSLPIRMLRDPHQALPGLRDSRPWQNIAPEAPYLGRGLLLSYSQLGWA